MQEQQLLSVFVLPVAFIRKSKEQNIALEKIKNKKYSILKLLHIFTESFSK